MLHAVHDVQYTCIWSRKTGVDPEKKERGGGGGGGGGLSYAWTTWCPQVQGRNLHTLTQPLGC